MSMSFRGKMRDGRRHAVVGAVRGEHVLVSWWRHLRRSGKIFVWRTVPRWVWIASLALGVGTVGFFLGHGKPGAGKSGSSQSSSGGGSSSGKQSAQAQPPAPAAPASNAPPTVSLDPQQLQYASLKMGTAMRTTLPAPLMALGSVAPNINGTAQVSPRLAGKVLRVLVNVGQTVQAGQTVAIVSSPELFNYQALYQDALLRQASTRLIYNRQLQLSRLGYYGRPALEIARVNAAQVQGEITSDQALVVSAQAAVAQAQASVNLTQKRYTRAQLLYQSQLLSRQDLQQSQADAQAATAALLNTQAAQAASVDRLRNARNRGSITQTALARQSQLYRSGAVSGEQIDPARNAYLLASHEVEATSAQLRLLGAPLVDESAPTGGLLPVRAPITGTVSARMASAGEPVTTDKPMLTLTNLKIVIVQLNVYQEDIAHLRPGLPVTVVSNTAPGRNYRGVISVLGTAVDPNTRTIPVYCAIRNTNIELRPGVYIAGKIYGAARAGVIAVPTDAVQISDKGHVVFTPGDKPGVYVAQPVQVGPTVGGLTQIKQGLSSGQPIVTTNAFILKSQMIKDTLN